jgi:hypothetical protein
MSRKRTIYNGVEMDATWPAYIEGAQKELYYVIGDSRHDRIRFGGEKPIRQTSPTCHDCSVILGQLHVRGCDREECPFCHRQAIACSCPFDRSQGWGGENESDEMSQNEN